MKLEFLWLKEFKNLKDFKVSFTASNPNDQPGDQKREPLSPEEDRFRVILGQNGSGKSNLLEALVIIFRDLDLGETTAFGYELHYTMNGGYVRVEVQSRPKTDSENEHFSFFVQARKLASPRYYKRKEVPDLTRDYRPHHVFSYYSGPSNRLERHFWKHQKKYSEALRKERDLPLRPFFYAMPIHSQFVLLAFFSSNDSRGREFLKKYFGITGMKSALFVMKEPHWKSKEGDPRFWNARWVVARFLDKLFTASLAPLRLKGTLQTNWEQAQTSEFLYMFLKDEKALKGLRGLAESDSDFFKELESTFMSDLIHETRIRVNVRGESGSLTFRELSEGEQQLLTVVGLLRFTRENESLFLLDEPDTHLNPAWGMKYLQILRDVADTGNHSQILLATHDPLAIASMRLEQVLSLERSEADNSVHCEHPDTDPRGLGVSGILKKLFGLRTTLDLPTQAKLDERFNLAAKAGDLSKSERSRLAELNQELAAAGFTDDFRDANYAQYAKAMGHAQSEGRVQLTSNELRELEQEALEVVEALEQGGEANA